MLEHISFGTRTAASEGGTGWQAALALRWRSECMHSSLAKDAAETADGVGKSLTAAAVVREHGGTGAGSLAEIEFRPNTVSPASGGGGSRMSELEYHQRIRLAEIRS